MDLQLHATLAVGLHVEDIVASIAVSQHAYDHPVTLTLRLALALLQVSAVAAPLRGCPIPTLVCTSAQNCNYMHSVLVPDPGVWHRFRLLLHSGTGSLLRQDQ